MTRSQTDELIRVTAKRLFAKFGYEGISMRILAQASGVGLSSIYHFFQDKDVLLKEVYLDTNRKLGQAREALPPQPTAQRMLEQLIEFQFEHIEDVVYVLKYYLHFRGDFAALPTKTLPAKSVLHIEEVVQKGIVSGEFTVAAKDVASKSKVVAHTINGYLLEYYPDVPHGAERREMIDDIVSFTMRGLK
ncbi:MAG TPA: TetR/AcrR family transcriptional regulator [Candidatus Saccharimonadales bacterium]|nr:TetR/AcrR family transcriptional regulator [Candidatus Saccharimonadales bacterium]